jgi:hypothetical protein
LFADSRDRKRRRVQKPLPNSVAITKNREKLFEEIFNKDSKGNVPYFIPWIDVHQGTSINHPIYDEDDANISNTPQSEILENRWPEGRDFENTDNIAYKKKNKSEKWIVID